MTEQAVSVSYIYRPIGLYLRRPTSALSEGTDTILQMLGTSKKRDCEQSPEVRTLTEKAAGQNLLELVS